MSRRLELTGKKFRRLTVLKLYKIGKFGHSYWDCVCDCVEVSVVQGDSLVRGTTMSCGCLARELSVKRCTTHGKAKSGLYIVWKHMKDRCENTKNISYKRYGGRGICVCDEWSKSVLVFCNWAENNGWGKGLEIDRIENNKGYYPGNCRFVSRSHNALNTRMRKNNKSGFKGVFFNAKSNNWRMQYRNNNIVRGKSGFNTAEEAYISRCSCMIANGVPVRGEQQKRG